MYLEGGTLSIRTSTQLLEAENPLLTEFGIDPGNYTRIDVADTGTGIADDDLSRIFEPFFTTKEEGKGTGLGLASVFSMVRAHAGAIGVETSIGVGTTFSVYLPLAGTGQESVLETTNVVHGSGTIMVVDDEGIIRSMVCDALRLLGYTVIDFAAPEQAIAFYADHADEVDLVILDMEMPNLNGIKTYQAMAKITPEMKVLGISGYKILFFREREVRFKIFPEHLIYF